MSISFPQDFKLAALIGKVQGVTQGIIAARAINIQTVNPPLTVGAGNVLQLFASANESWEIVSSNAADAAAGTGARTVLVQYLDDAYVQQQALITLNGVTPVAVAANCFRAQSIQVVTAGSGQTNAGTLTLRVAGAGATRAIVTIASSSSRIGSFTTPAGYVFYIQNTSYTVGRATGPGVLATIAAYLYSNGVRRLGLDFTIGEPGIEFTFESGIVIPERTTLEYQVTAVSANGVDVSILASGLLVNTAILSWPIT